MMQSSQKPTCTKSTISKTGFRQVKILNNLFDLIENLSKFDFRGSGRKKLRRRLMMINQQQLHQWCNREHAHIEFNRSWVQAMVGSNQRLWNLYFVPSPLGTQFQWSKEQRMVGSESG